MGWPESGNVTDVDGSATYEGGATGVYTRNHDYDAATGDLINATSGHFTADVALEATFGQLADDSIAPNMLNTVTGTIDGFTLNPSEPGGPEPANEWSVTRAHKRDVDKDALRESWQRQAADLGFDAHGLTARAAQHEAGRTADRESLAHAEGRAGTTQTKENAPDRAVAWAVEHLSEREAVFSRTSLLTAALAWRPGAVTIGEAEAAVARLEKAGTLLAANHPVPGDSLTTDKAVAEERETVALMERGRGRGAVAMRGRTVRQGVAQRPPHQRTEGGGEADPCRTRTAWSAFRAMPGPARPPC